MCTGLRASDPLGNGCFPLNIDMRRRTQPNTQHFEVGNYVEGVPGRNVVRYPEHDDFSDVHRELTANGSDVALLGLQTQVGVRFGGLEDMEVLQKVPDIKDDCSDVVRTRPCGAIPKKVDALGKIV